MLIRNIYIKDFEFLTLHKEKLVEALWDSNGSVVEWQGNSPLAVQSWCPNAIYVCQRRIALLFITTLRKLLLL